MFTGLIEGVGTVSSLKGVKGGLKISVRPHIDMELRVGDSLAVNGVCLTVVTIGREIVFEVSPETIRSTNLGELKTNDRLNLERPLKLTDRLGGHIVTGHVDGIGIITDKKKEGEYTLHTFEVSREILNYVVKKGSIAVDGISLTVTGLNNSSFSVAIIPHTLHATNIGDKGIGSRVNIEVDIIGKYVEKFMTMQNSDRGLKELLKEKGFTE
ncbi:MAG: riboflavin synthase [Thermodesulfovibrionia bacterium]|nr:riboflavin synthase [Thermodesulfovibrionia bacterium]MCK5427712.1 riboflavin synthase [Thermodesulfovibrionia bacterium]MCK5512644.1 riboflavin synthase [Thermodesulfovibrionia bacterium]